MRTCALFSVGLYFFSGQMNLRNRYSHKSYCDQNITDEQVCAKDGLLTDWQVFSHNFLWTLGFYGGLWFTHLDLGILGGISITMDSIKNQWTVIQKILIPMIGIFVIGLIFYFIDLIWQAGWEYIMFYFLYAVSIICVSVYLTMLYPAEETHFHHWWMFMLINTFCSHPNFLVTVAGAYSQGVFVEGCSRWGLDPVWVQVDIPQRLTEFRAKFRKT